MNTLNLAEWTIYIAFDCITVQQYNMIVVLSSDKQCILILSANEKGNIVVERCCKDCRCEIEHEQKKILLEWR